MLRTWPVAHWLALPETGEHRRGGSKHSACSSNKVRKIARIFLSDAEILSGRGPGWTGLEGGVSEGRLRLSIVEIKQDGRGGSGSVCRGQTLPFSDRRTLGKNGGRCCGALGLDGNSNISFMVCFKQSITDMILYDCSYALLIFYVFHRVFHRLM